jgi:hypothetical protein
MIRDFTDQVFEHKEDDAVKNYWAKRFVIEGPCGKLCVVLTRAAGGCHDWKVQSSCQNIIQTWGPFKRTGPPRGYPPSHMRIKCSDDPKERAEAIEADRRLRVALELMKEEGAR